MTTEAAERINALARRNNAKTYLEIGVRAGETFFAVDIPAKVAVDPVFRFDPGECREQGCLFYPMTSDEFFAGIEERPELAPLRDKRGRLTFDVIFIDGLHTYEQTLLDFVNSLRYAHSKTLWIIDDTVPSDPYSALPGEDDCFRYRRAAGVLSGSWHGDVYKLIFKLYMDYRQFSYCTVLHNGNPQTVVWKTRERRKDEGLTLPGKYADLGYFDIFPYAEIFFPVNDDILFKLLYQCVNPLSYPQQEAWRMLFYQKTMTTTEFVMGKQLSKLLALSRSEEKKS